MEGGHGRAGSGHRGQRLYRRLVCRRASAPRLRGAYHRAGSAPGAGCGRRRIIRGRPGGPAELRRGRPDRRRRLGRRVKGVDYVLHVASPLGGGTPDAMITAARDGTLRVLRAAVAAGVKRVVMTSAANAASPSSYAAGSVGIIGRMVSGKMRVLACDRQRQES